jgi:hypothetical protein
MTAMDLTVAEIREELSSAPVVVEPHWLKILGAVRYSSLSRSKLYELIDEGEVRSVCLRDKDKIRGVRLISRPSLEAYLAKHEGTKSEQVPGRKGRKSKKEKKAEVL